MKTSDFPSVREARLTVEKHMERYKKLMGIKKGKAMIELPEQERGFFCTKCGSDVCKPETITQPHPPCAKCGYLGFAADRGYTADQLRTYGDQRAAEARGQMREECIAAAMAEHENSNNLELIQIGALQAGRAIRKLP